MSQLPHPSSLPPALIELTEWDAQDPSNNASLKGLSFGDAQTRRYAQTLRDRVVIREGRDGIEVETNSHVGRIDVGPIRVAIGPKLPAMPLGRLLRYTYGLRDIEAISETHSPTSLQGFQDILISLLAAEVEDLLRQGLARQYRSRSEMLASPRGELLFSELIRLGGILEPRLPCRFFERSPDWRLNGILRTGVQLAIRLTEDRDLRQQLYQVDSLFGQVQPFTRLSVHDIDHASRALTRLTENAEPALTLIRLVLEGQGLAFAEEKHLTAMTGFLFDMNKFFQRLLSRFLRENLYGLQIEDERSVHQLLAFAKDGNPRKRTAPKLRPDYALFDGVTPRGYLDAKYRDIWSMGLPPNWLYQLAMYALGSPTQVSVLLYATMSDEASDERIEVQQPLRSSDVPPASVILRPVPVTRLAKLVGRSKAGQFGAERRIFAHQLVAMQSGAIGTKTSRAGRSEAYEH